MTETPLLVAHPDWPANEGSLDLEVHDAPHRSSGIEWWYINLHLTTEDGCDYSAFAAFFRTADQKGSDSPISHSHVVSWSLVDVANRAYAPETRMDRETVEVVRDIVAADEGVIDRRFARALTTSLAAGQPLLPDLPMAGPVTVADRGLALTFGQTASFAKDNEGCYLLWLLSEDGGTGVDIRMTPTKSAVRYAEDGIVQGTHEDNRDGMFYYFIPRCSLSGSVRVNGVRKKIASGSAWYDHEFGGVPRDRTQGFQPYGSSWQWAGIQLDNGWDLSFATVRDVDLRSGQDRVRQTPAVAVDPQGRRFPLGTHTMTGSDEWMSVQTYNSYDTTWRVTSPFRDIDLTLRPPFPEQEVRTMAAGRGFWEGRVDVRGTMDGVPVSGLAFVELNPAQTLINFEEHLSRAAEETRREVVKLYPDTVDAAVTADLAGSNANTEDVPHDEIGHALVRPVRHLVDARGKAWRGFLLLAAVELTRGDASRRRPLLAAAELLHVGSLIIDDIQDDSSLRRGVEAVHKVWGTAHAINAGTAAYYAFDRIIRKSGSFTDQELGGLYRAYFDAVRSAHVGQALDLTGHWSAAEEGLITGDMSQLERRILNTHRLKTAAPARSVGQFGVLLGDVPSSVEDPMCDFFEAIGLAYQIVDDVLDLRISSNVLRKPPGQDLKEAKITYPVARALTLLDEPDRKDLLARIRARPQSLEAITECVSIIEGCGALDSCMTDARKLLDDSWAALDPLLPPSQAKVAVESFAWYIIERGTAD